MMQRRGLNPRLLESSESRLAAGRLRRMENTRRALARSLFTRITTASRQIPNSGPGSLPWQPILRTAAMEAGGTILPDRPGRREINPEWRLYGRSASDDKAGVMAILTAFDALKANGMEPSRRTSSFFLKAKKRPARRTSRKSSIAAQGPAEADAWIICDGPVHQSGRKQVVFGVRGDTNVDVTVYGAKRPLHSGHYGNWSPNPAMTLARLLASMKDENRPRTRSTVGTTTSSLWVKLSDARLPMRRNTTTNCEPNLAWRALKAAEELCSS